MRKKILFVLHDSSTKSGATASMLTVLEYLLDDFDLEVNVLIPNAKGDLESFLIKKKVSYEKVRILPVRVFKEEKFINKTLSFLRGVKNLTYTFLDSIKFSLNNKKKYDYIYTNTSSIYYGYFISVFMRTPHIWHVREFGVEDQNLTHLLGEKFYYKYLLKKAYLKICISKALERKLSNYGLKDNVKVIYNDIQYPFNAIKGFYNSIPKILVAGSVITGKGQMDIVEALYLLKEKGIVYKLIIAGDDSSEYAKKLRGKINEYAMNVDVDMIGHTNELSIIRNECDIGIISSNSEAFGRVTIEGMLAGLVIVATDSGANSELIIDGCTGYLYENKNIHSLASVLERVYLSRPQWDTVRINSRRYAEQFTKNNAAIKISNLIKHDS